MLFIAILISRFLFLSPVGSQKMGIEIEANQINDTVSVRQFGAKGDGVTDDSPAFQMAMNTRKVVIVPATSKSYYIGKTVRVYNSVIGKNNPILQSSRAALTDNPQNAKSWGRFMIFHIGNKQDIKQYHLRFPEEKAYQQNELDMQLHYMRRMLNPCMSIIDKEMPLYQMFSSPDVFSYIWSLDPDYRTDKIYYIILQQYAPELLEVPWARNGVTYLSENETPDKYSKKHHQYGVMIRQQFFNLIENKIEEHSEIAGQIFDLKNLKRLVKNVKNYPLDNSFSYEEKLLWIAALLEFIKTHDIKVELPENKKVALLNSLKEDLTYKAKFIYKKIK